MLLEIMGGRKNIDIQVSHSSQFYFPDRAIKLVERGELRTRLREREERCGGDQGKESHKSGALVYSVQFDRETINDGGASHVRKGCR
ncbi:hypothetical protein SUGI_0116570 [Cryptomeria japonica]|nr:hypothetical protein SUGI_0116570 [Cryptomeria japonica]